jgi:hypothetical protein
MLSVSGEPLQVIRPLGGGATSRVVLAARGATEVVVKLGRDKGQRPRFADEAERLCLVDSPWVAPLLDVTAQCPVLVKLGGTGTMLNVQWWGG